MQAKTIKKVEVSAPKYLTFKQAAPYCGLSVGTLHNYEKLGMIVVYNVITPGSCRGRKLIDRESLDRMIEGSLGNVTTIDVCNRKAIRAAKGGAQ